MQIVDVYIHQFRRLQNWRLEGLGAGLNVICGPNGSGKTTLLRCLRNLLCGSGETKRSAKPGAPREAVSGSLRIRCLGRTARLSRRVRSGHSETRMVSSPGDDATSNACIWRYWNRFAALDASDVLPMEFCHETRSRQVIPALRSIHQIGVRPQQSGSVVPSLASHADDEDLMQAYAAAEQAREQLHLQAAAVRRAQHRRLRETESKLSRLDAEIAACSAHARRLDFELQAVVTDLRECEDRLWSGTGRPFIPNTGELPLPARGSGIGSEDDLERQVETAQQFVRDVLMWRTVSTLTQLGPGESTKTARQRANRWRLAACEDQALAQLEWLREQLTARQTHMAGQTDSADGRRMRLAGQIETLGRQRVALARQLGEASVALRNLRQDRREKLNEYRTIASSRELDEVLFALRGVERRVVDCRLNLAAHRWSSDVIRNRSLETVGNSDRVLSNASRWFLSLTGGRFERIATDEQREQIVAITPDGDTQQLATLSRGAQQQALLAIQLAMAAALARRGIPCPVLVDDVLSESDDVRMENAIRVLRKATGSGLQIIVVTCRRHVSDMFHAAGVRVFDMGSDGATVRSHANAPVPSASEPPATDVLRVARRERVHPAEACWLRSSSPVMLIPSVTPLFARHLVELGVFEVRDVLRISNAFFDDGHADRSISAAQFRQVCAEAHLLSSVPGLVGRDAQLLVRCGIMEPADLATSEADKLVAQIDRELTGHKADVDAVGPAWPGRQTVLRWIASANRTGAADSRGSLFAGGERSAAADRSGDALDSGVTRPGAGRPRTDPETRLTAAGRQTSRTMTHLALLPESDITAVVGIGEAVARRLKKIGIDTVARLLNCDADDVARRAGYRRAGVDKIREWQRVAGLMCRVPDLGAVEAQLLVSVGVASLSDLRRISGSALHASLMLLRQSPAGRRLLCDGEPPTRDKVEAWIACAHQPQATRAA